MRTCRQVPELRVEIQQLKAKNHGLNTQVDALAQDHERLAGLLAVANKVQNHDQAFGMLCFFCCPARDGL